MRLQKGRFGEPKPPGHAQPSFRQVRGISTGHGVSIKEAICTVGFFTGVTDATELNIVDVKQLVPFQRGNGKNMEFDVIAESGCGRVVVDEVKKMKEATGLKSKSWRISKKSECVRGASPRKNYPVFLSLVGFVVDAGDFCTEREIGTADKIRHF